MTSGARAALLAWLRVPPEPTAPAGDSNVRVFRAAPNYFRYKVLLWTLQKAAQVVGLVAVLFLVPDVPFRGRLGVGLGPFTMTQQLMTVLFAVFETVAVAGFVVQSAVSAAILRLDFEQRWYLVSDRSVRIREGLVFLSEKTMTFANVQHVAIRQNIVQRWLGIADVEVRTAGGGSGKKESQRNESELHVGFLRGIEHAEGVRDVIRERLKRRQRDTAGSGGTIGLPDAPAPPLPDAPVPPRLVAAAPPFPARGLAEAAEALHLEARALRHALEHERTSRA